MFGRRVGHERMKRQQTNFDLDFMRSVVNPATMLRNRALIAYLSHFLSHFVDRNVASANEMRTEDFDSFLTM